MNYTFKLSGLLPGESCVVKNLESRPEIRRRLQDMGLVPKTRVKCLFQSPFGDPCAYLVRGAVIALRRDDADDIFVSPIMGGD